MQEVVKKEHESFENLFRRFNRRVQQSGKLSLAKRNQFFEKPLSKSKRREEALRKSKIKNIRKTRQGRRYESSRKDR